MKKNFTWLLLLAGLSFSVPSMAQNFAISLDGVTNSVTTPAQIVPAASDFTVEFWAYVPSLAAGNHEFLSQGTVGSGAFYIGYDGSGNIRVGDNWMATGVPVPLGSWFHLAVTYFAATTTANLYINDVIQATNTTFPALVAGGSNFAVGAQTDGTELMQAEMDELNVWSVARTQASIKGSWLKGLNPADPTFTNVIAYYQMNEGSGTTLDNISNTSGLNGTITGTVTGSTWASSPIQWGVNGLAFDGVSDDKVVVPPNALWDGLSSATIEMNVNPGTNAGNADFFGVRGVQGGISATKFNFFLTNFSVGMWNGSAQSAVGATLTPGTWYHLSFVVDGAQDTTGVFMDGVYIGQIPLSFGATTGLPVVMGLSQNPGSDAEFYTGSLDEVRIWNTMLTQAQIQGFMSEGLVGNEPNLVALWNFDEGIAGGNNSFLNTAFDATSSNNHGTLTNFLLSGSASNFVTGSSIVPLPVNFTSFTAVAQGKEALLQWQTAQEQNSSTYSVERSPDGSPSSFTPIGTLPAAGNSSTARSYDFRDVSPLIGMNYYQLKETDLDGRFMYSPIRSLKFAFAGSSELTWIKNGDKSVEIDLLQGNTDSYIITDLLGRTIQQGQMSFGKTYLNNVTAGIYVVKVFAPSGVQYSAKVLVQ
jgi:hypothetical protein